jgi:hypothetical protein
MVDFVLPIENVRGIFGAYVAPDKIGVGQWETGEGQGSCDVRPT